MPLEVQFADEIGDAPLRLLFVCCHEAVPGASGVTLALRTLCGFNTALALRRLDDERRVKKNDDLRPRGW